MFERRRDLFTGLDLVFFDTPSLYFEGDGGETIGQYGYCQRPPAGLEANDCGSCSRQLGISVVLRTLAREHDGREES